MSLSRMMKQTATYWELSAVDGYNEPTFASPVTIDCRWQDKQEAFINEFGDQEVSKSIVYCSDILALNGYLYLGTSTSTTPRSVTSAHPIKGVQVSPDIKALRFLYKIFL